jgi:hypothetical protein
MRLRLSCVVWGGHEHGMGVNGWHERTCITRATRLFNILNAQTLCFETCHPLCLACLSRWALRPLTIMIRTFMPLVTNVLVFSMADAILSSTAHQTSVTDSLHANVDASAMLPRTGNDVSNKHTNNISLPWRNTCLLTLAGAASPWAEGRPASALGKSHAVLPTSPVRAWSVVLLLLFPLLLTSAR